MKIVEWEKHGEVQVGIDENRYKRAVILREGPQYYGYAPLGCHESIREYVGTNTRQMCRRIQAALKEL